MFLADAMAILDGKQPLPPFPACKGLVAQLKGRSELSLARKVLTKMLAGPWDKKQSVWATQQLALCTYKDDELLPAKRLADALALLESIGLRAPAASDPARIDPDTLPETLALGGAVFKRRWEYGGQIEDLHLALSFYRRAWEKDPKLDLGYGGVNAAYVLDLLAARARVVARRASADPTEATRLADEATKLRSEMKTTIPRHAAGAADQYWFLATMAEIHFGLGEYEEAGDLLARARRAPAPEWEQETTWERQTTFRQLVTLARAQDVDLSEKATDPRGANARAALRKFLGDETDAALSCFRGRVGLALSGGGFRASLFHLGVLARLAECGVLRNVEVLSTVSGGSIVGALYYLEVQHHLEKTNDADILDGDYVTIVDQVIKQFMAGIETNIRMRAMSNLIANLRMALDRSYSRSHRVGELYEEEIYGRASDAHVPGKPRLMRDLLIKPADFAGDARDFKPRFANWKRRGKVPLLLLNATSLNSGHSWHFTGRWMGEPPGLLGPEVDVNERYRRLWYEQAPTPALRDVRLGAAVAASACVPGLFDPLTLTGLYPGRTVRLVDGGVHDNQGVGGLLNEGCTLILCSDASGQMADIKRPSDGLLGVPLRTNGVLMSRVRELEYQDLRGRADSRAIHGFLFVHLKKGLEVQPLDWIRCDDPTTRPAGEVSKTDTAYGVDKDLQRKLAGIRTDLDSFTEVEAYALMLSGYLMTTRELEALDEQHQKDREPGTWGDFDIRAGRDQRWPFLKLLPLIRLPPDSSDARREDLGRQLAASASSAFKIWQLSTTLKAVALLSAAGALVYLGWLLHDGWNTSVEIAAHSIPVRRAVAGIALATAAFFVPILKWLRPYSAVRGYLARVIVGVVGSIVATAQLLTFDRLYKCRGRLHRLLNLR